MLTLRPDLERGRAEHGWLDSRHTFSFGDYHDPKHMGFRALRVINEDRVRGGQGFGRHPHANMEILSYVLEGALDHADSTGIGSTIRPGDVQRMSAGSGVTHSELNGSQTEPVHFLQIWLLPNARGISPGYEQKRMDHERGRLRVIASPDGRDGSVTVHSDAVVYAGVFGPGDEAEQVLEHPYAWVQVARGSLVVNGETLRAGDGAALRDERSVRVSGDGEILLFDLA